MIILQIMFYGMNFVHSKQETMGRRRLSNDLFDGIAIGAREIIFSGDEQQSSCLWPLAGTDG